MKKLSKTNWQRIDRMKDKDIDYSDIPELDQSFFDKAHMKLPTKKAITIRLDENVVEWFKHLGKGYQTKINKLLRSYVEAHR